MAEEIKYTINGKGFTTPVPKRKVADLLSEINLTAQEFILVSPDNTEHGNPDELIDIHNGDAFTTKPKKDKGSKGNQVIRYKVNGEELKTTISKMTVEEILKAAGKSASVNVNDLSNYFLQDLKSEHRYENLTDVVSISEGDQYLAVYRGKVPVA